MPQRSFAFTRERSIDERFAEFLRLNPHVYAAFRSAAIKLRRAGHERFSSKGIVEGLRFNDSLKTTSVDHWKINNNFTSRLARKLIAENPSFAGFFETRTLKSD
jgi:hypothetical protein